MRLARGVFLGAGAVGLLKLISTVYLAIVGGGSVLPQADGAGLLLVLTMAQYAIWQIACLVVSKDPVRYRPIMVLAILMTLTDPFNPVWLYMFGYLVWLSLIFVDIAMAVLMMAAYLTASRAATRVLVPNDPGPERTNSPIRLR